MVIWPSEQQVDVEEKWMSTLDVAVAVAVAVDAYS